MASRSEDRLTPMEAASSRSGGKGSPALSCRSEISAISGGGRVAGVAEIDGPTLDPAKAVRVEGSLPLTPVDRSQRTHDQVHDVNDANVVVGTSEILGSQGATEPFVWTDRKHVLPTPDASYRMVRTRSVNESGWVLGSGYRLDAQGAYHHHVLLWRPDLTVIELPPLPEDATFVAEHPVPQAARLITQHIERMWTSVTLVERTRADLGETLRTAVV